MQRHAGTARARVLLVSLLTSKPQVTVDDIAGYERTYRGSAEEERDLKELFTRFGGDMNQCVHRPLALVCLHRLLTQRASPALSECLTGCAARARTLTRTAFWRRCARQ